MSIIGLTDKPLLRRDGKIRAGYKDEKNNNKLVNTDYFLLHDALDLAKRIGEKPTEIFFTVHSDRPEEFMKSDLRWYSSSQLLCRSMHNAPDTNGQPMGSVAAYTGVGMDVQGLRQNQFPGVERSRIRSCGYKSCPEYVKGMCSEHMFLDIIVPQYNMGAVFTLDTTSINAIINAHSTFQKAWTRYGGKLSGQIYKMVKKPGTITYQKQDGKQGKRDAPMIWFELVNFQDYEAAFRNEIMDEDWQALMSIRNRSFISTPVGEVAGYLDGSTSSAPALSAAQPTQGVAGALAGPNTGIVPTDDDAVKARANDPIIVPFFEEYGKLMGREATEAVRIATMKNIPTVEQGVTYLKNKIAEAKKNAKKAQPAEPPAQQAPPPQEAAPSGGAGLY